MTQWPKKGEGIDEDLDSVDARGVEAAADWDSLWFPETTSGMSEVRTSRLPMMRSWIRRTYMPPRRGCGSTISALAGDWTVKRGATVLNQAEGQIVYRFHARDLHLVMAPAGAGGVPSGSGWVSTAQPPGCRPRRRRRRPGRRHPHRPAALPSSSASPAPSATAPSRSASSTPVSRPTPSPSARPGPAPPTANRVLQELRRLGFQAEAVQRGPGPMSLVELLLADSNKNPSMDASVAQAHD
jgi:Thioredoxin like C-terminal domain